MISAILFDRACGWLKWRNQMNYRFKQPWFMLGVFTMSAFVMAEPPRERSMPAVHELAGQLRQDINSLSNRAYDHKGSFGKDSGEALERIGQFQNAADRFYKSASRNFEDPSKTQDEFWDLQRAYRAASRYIDRSFENDKIDRAWDRTKD